MAKAFRGDIKAEEDKMETREIAMMKKMHGQQLYGSSKRYRSGGWQLLTWQKKVEAMFR